MLEAKAVPTKLSDIIGPADVHLDLTSTSRTPLLDRIHVVFGRQPQGVAWCGADGDPVRLFFLLAAPPAEVSNEIRSSQEFLGLLAEAGL